MRTLWLVALFWLAWQSPAQELNTQALREAIPLPKVIPDASIQVFEGTDYPAIRKARQEISLLEKRMKRGKADAGTLLRLYELYLLEDGARERTDLLNRALALARKRTQTNPRDGEAWLQLGVALRELGRKEEAERALRKATQLSPNSWKAWHELGRTILFGRLASAFASRPFAPPDDAARQAEWMAGLAELQARFEEGLRCVNRAVTLAPAEPEVYRTRLGARVMQAMWKAIMQRLQNPDAEVRLTFPQEVLADVRRLTELAPDDLSVVVGAISLTFFPYLSGASTSEGIDWDKIPPPAKAEFHRWMSRIEQMTKSRDREQASMATRVLGGVRFMIAQFREQGVSDVRRAIAMRPEDEHAWLALVAMLTAMGKTSEAIAECQRWVARRDNATARTVLSALLYETDDAEQALREVRRALQLKPNLVEANLLLAGYLLKHHELRPTTLAQVQRLLGVVAPQMNEGTMRRTRADFLVLQGAYQALTGKHATARQMFQRAKGLDPSVEEIDELLKLIPDN